jgi:glycosyltransferase involved in cell wall biosynthesis
MKEEAFYLGTAGRPSSVKGHDILLRAFARLQQAPTERLPEVRLAIFSDESRRGPGSYNDLTSIREALGLQTMVELRPGFVEDMRKVYWALDAYVLPSRGSEGSSRAGLEASASGLPLIASRVGVLPDLIEGDRTGILVAPGDEKCLASALTAILNDPPKTLALGMAARTRIQSFFSEESYAQGLTGELNLAFAEAWALNKKKGKDPF